MTNPADPGAKIPAGVVLCRLDDLADPGARNVVLQIGERCFHGFLVRTGETVRGYADRCPHMGLPLAQTLDDYLTPNGCLIACSWHGALFAISDGVCVGGPCMGSALTQWPVRNDRGNVVTA